MWVTFTKYIDIDGGEILTKEQATTDYEIIKTDSYITHKKTTDEIYHYNNVTKVCRRRTVKQLELFNAS